MTTYHMTAEGPRICGARVKPCPLSAKGAAHFEANNREEYVRESERLTKEAVTKENIQTFAPVSKSAPAAPYLPEVGERVEINEEVLKHSEVKYGWLVGKTGEVVEKENMRYKVRFDDGREVSIPWKGVSEAQDETPPEGVDHSWTDESMDEMAADMEAQQEPTRVRDLSEGIVNTAAGKSVVKNTFRHEEDDAQDLQFENEADANNAKDALHKAGLMTQVGPTDENGTWVRVRKAPESFVDSNKLEWDGKNSKFSMNLSESGFSKEQVGSGQLFMKSSTTGQYVELLRVQTADENAIEFAPNDAGDLNWTVSFKND